MRRCKEGMANIKVGLSSYGGEFDPNKSAAKAHGSLSRTAKTSQSRMGYTTNFVPSSNMYRAIEVHHLRRSMSRLRPLSQGSLEHRRSLNANLSTKITIVWTRACKMKAHPTISP